MKDLTLNELQEACVNRCNKYIRPLKEWTPLEYGGALAGEVGELCNILKKVRRGTQELDKKTLEHIGEELGDILQYLPLVAESVGVNLDQAVRDKFNKVSKKWDCPARL